MKLILRKKTIIISLLLIMSCTAFLYTTFVTRCFVGGCNDDLREGIVVPFFWFSIGLSGVISLFLFFKEMVFKSWVKKIAWWYILVLIFLILSTPINSSNMMSIDRAPLALYGMVLLGVISLVYIGYKYKKL